MTEPMPPGRRPNVPRVRARARKRALFLRVLGETGNVTEACRRAKVGRTQVYAWRESDVEFRKAWGDAEEVAMDAVEAEIRRRGLEGFDETTIEKDGKGKTITTKRVRRYSDRLLEVLARAHRPAFRESRVEVSGPGGGPVQTQSTVSMVDVVNAAAKAAEARAASPAPIAPPGDDPKP